MGQVYLDIDGRLYDGPKAQACRERLQFARACARRDDEKSYFGKAEVKQ